MIDETAHITYDPDYQLATFYGPGGFTQVTMSRRQAEAIATALGVEFVDEALSSEAGKR